MVACLAHLCSIRWKVLLSFNCRNRLLLTGTPIQNTMQEVSRSRGQVDIWLLCWSTNHLSMSAHVGERVGGGGGGGKRRYFFMTMPILKHALYCD